VTNPQGERTLSISDAAGRSLRSVTLASDDTALLQTTQTYDALFTLASYGDILETSSTNLMGHVTKRRTDGAGRTLQSVDGGGFISTVAYNASGNALSTRDPNGVGQDCEFDVLGRDIECTDTANITTQSVYNLVGNKVQAIDAKNHSTYYLFDARGRQTKLTDRLGGITEFTFDAAGNQLTLEDAENQVTIYVYDNLGRLIQTNWPDHIAMTSPGDADFGITHTLYDAAGQLIRTTDQLGDTLTYHFDLAGRLERIEGRARANSPSGTTAFVDDFTHDAASRLLTAESGQYGNTVTRTYQDGRLANESLAISGQTYTVERHYGVTTPTVTLTYPDGSEVVRTSNSRGLLAQIDRNSATILEREYDDGGRMTEQTLGNSIFEQFTWRDDNLPATWAMPNGASAYSYDENKNRTADVIAGLLSGHSWTTGTSGFDDEDRLIARNQGSGNLQEEWELSLVGDFDSVTVNSVMTSRTHGPLHQLVAVGGTSLEYDAKDNLTIDEEGRVFAWSLRNRLESVDVDADTTTDAIFEYDATGRKVKQILDGVTTILVPLDRNVIAEYASGSAAESPLRTYVGGASLDEWILIADRTDAGDISAGIEEPLYLHADAGRNVRGITNAVGDCVELYAYSVFGVPTVLDPSTLLERTATAYGNRHLFTGREWLAEVGCYDFRSRQYSAALGRFLSRDIIGYPDGPNVYSAWFVPDWADPLGTDAVLVRPGVRPMPIVKTYPGLCRYGGAASVGLCDGPQPGPADVIAVGAVGCQAAWDLGTYLGDCIADEWYPTGPDRFIGRLPRSPDPDIDPDPEPEPKPDPIDLPPPPPNDPCEEEKKCKPCEPPVGSIAYRIDREPSKPHKTANGIIDVPHSHKFEMQQSPYPVCRCFWHEVLKHPLAGEHFPVIGPAGGGGPM
jgi:RHS repeat-associated protein